MGFWGWAAAIGAGWLIAAAVVVAAAWRAGGKRGPRPVPGDAHLHVVVYDEDSYPVMSDDVFDVEREGL